jgi:hypothetical protein
MKILITYPDDWNFSHPWFTQPGPLSQLPNGTHNDKDHLHECREISARPKEREVSLP